MNKYLVLIALVVLAQTINIVEVDQTSKIELKANTPTSFSLAIPKPQNQPPSSEDLFILADPIIASPSQLPAIEVTLDNGTVVSCLTDDNQLEGICRLSTSLLGSNVSLTLLCQEDCAFWLRIYINDVPQLLMGHSYRLIHKKSEMIIFEFELKVPADQFDELCVYLTFERSSGEDYGVEMYANVGNRGALYPDQQNYQYKAEPLQEGIILDLPKEDLPLGTWLKISLFSQFQGQMKLATFLSTGDSYILPLNDPTYGAIAHGKVSIFNVSLLEYQGSLQQLDINIEVLLYSGYPEISASFVEDFSRTLENYGVGGDLNYLITPEIRKTFNFKGMIYLRLQAFNHEVSFKVTATITSNAFVSMREGFSYLAVTESETVKNYLHDFQYISDKGASPNDTLQFTVKVEMMKGSVMYYSRICSQSDSKKCLVGANDLDDPAFINDTNALRGQIIHYYSIYEIFQWIELPQCSKSDYNSTHDQYFCRLQVLLHTNQQETQWIITIYSRQNSIELREGQAFKDKVFEDSYNYYYYIPPKDPFQNIAIIVTVLTGETSLLTSQVFTKPEFIFQQQDPTMKISSKHSVSYHMDQVKGKIFIGVYGESMAEYLLHVVITKNGTQSILQLVPQLGQLFRLPVNSAEIKFRMVPNSAARWQVQVTPINDNLNFKVSSFLSNNSTPFCSSSSIHPSQCSFESQGKDSYQLTIQRNSSSSSNEIKFVVAYYPQEECRILPLGTPNLMSLHANSSSCVQYILDGREVVFAYSRNIISALNYNISLDLSINGKPLQDTQGHYKIIKELKIKEKCSEGEGKTGRCVLKVNITGNPITDIDIWVTTALTQAAVPLFSGVLLPFSRSHTSQTTPLRFYYEQTDASPVTLLVRSLTYAPYSLQYRWMDESVYLSANSDSQIYPALSEGSVPTVHITPEHRFLELQVKQDSKCTNCILLVSIWPEQFTSSNVFQLQIITKSLALGLGQTKKGELDTEQSIMFMFSNIKKDAIVHFSGYQRSHCYSIRASDKTKKEQQIEVQSQELILAAGKDYEVELIGQQDKCNYEVSLWGSDSPIRSIRGGNTYSVKLDDSQQTLYFLYYHALNSSFWVYQVITSGALLSYATPLQDKSLEQAIKSQQFLFGSISPYQDLYVSSSNPSFCYDCYYLLKLEGHPAAEVQIGISDPYTPVVLPLGGVVREKIQQSSSRLFQYFTFEAFTIRMTIVRGSLLIKLVDDTKKVILSRVVDKDGKIEIPNSEGIFMGYQIELQAQETSVYALQIVEPLGVRLIDGIPFSYHFQANTKAEFMYSHKAVSKAYVAVMIENQSKQTEMPQIDVVVRQMIKDGKSVTVLPQIINGNMALFSFEAGNQDYIFAFTISAEVSAKVLITRNQLTYLPAGIELTTFKPSIFQIDTKGHGVMLQAFACKGSIELQATEDYEYFQKNKEEQNLDKSPVIVLEHNNIAGHYVVNSQSSSPQFYAKLLGDMYRISYSYIKEQAPYKQFTTVNYNLNYDLNKEFILLTLQLPLPKASLRKKNQIKAEYQLTYGRAFQDVKTFSQCRTGGSVVTIKNDIGGYPDLKENFEADINRESIGSLFAAKLDNIYIACTVFITYLEDDRITTTLEYIYDPLFIDFKDGLTNLDQTSYSWLTDVFLLLFVVLIVGVVFVISARFCWRFWKIYRANRGYVLQEEQNSSIDVINNGREEVAVKT